LTAIINSNSGAYSISLTKRSIWGQSKLQPDLKDTASLGCNVLTTDHDIVAVFYAGGCFDDFSNHRLL
jgi:hypothetical protein